MWLMRKRSATVSERIRLRLPVSKASMTLRVVLDSGLFGVESNNSSSGSVGSEGRFPQPKRKNVAVAVSG